MTNFATRNKISTYQLQRSKTSLSESLVAVFNDSKADSIPTTNFKD
ncbi:hypothetical protein [Helicobacter marmotae]|nr:hypothetical protein [Helicobacter marmotae]